MATIKLSNSVLIGSESLKIGVDATNLLASGTFSSASTSSSFVASQDGWFFANLSSKTVRMSGTTLFPSDSFSGGVTIFLRKGQAVGNSSTTASSYKFYGLL